MNKKHLFGLVVTLSIIILIPVVTATSPFVYFDELSELVRFILQSYKGNFTANVITATTVNTQRLNAITINETNVTGSVTAQGFCIGENCINNWTGFNITSGDFLYLNRWANITSLTLRGSGGAATITGPQQTYMTSDDASMTAFFVTNTNFADLIAIGTTDAGTTISAMSDGPLVVSNVGNDVVLYPHGDDVNLSGNTIIEGSLNVTGPVNITNNLTSNYICLDDNCINNWSEVNISGGSGFSNGTDIEVGYIEANTMKTNSTMGTTLSTTRFEYKPNGDVILWL